MAWRLFIIALASLLVGCGPSLSGVGRAPETRLSDAEARAMVERAEHARERNSKVTRPERRFTEESL